MSFQPAAPRPANNPTRFDSFPARELDVLLTALFNLDAGRVGTHQQDELRELRAEVLEAYQRATATVVRF